MRKEKFLFFVVLIYVVSCTGKLKGPEPIINSVVPRMGWNGVTNEITISGSGFGVMIAGCVAHQKVELPELYLMATSPILLSVKFWSPEMITATIPVTDKEGNFPLILTNPNGATTEFPSGYTLTSNPCEVPPNFVTVSSVSPKVIPNTKDNLLLVSGSGFMDTPHVWLAQGSICINGELNVKFINGENIEVTVPGGVPPGIYSIVVINPNGYTGRLDNALLVVSYTLTVSGIYPPFGWKEEATPVYIYGEGFTSTPQVFLESSTGYTHEVTRVAFISDSSLSGVVPEHLPPGVYSVIVINPDGIAGRLEGAFRITNLPPPSVDNINPGSGNTSENPTVTISGSNFRSPVRMTLINSSLQEVKGNCSSPESVISVSSVFSDIITATVRISNCNISAGVYLLRVMNTDESSYYDWASFVITNPASNPGFWEVSQNFLVKGRAGLAVVSGRDDLKRIYLYAIGGSNGKPGDIIYDDVEVAQLDPFGRVGKWNLIPNRMNKKRFASSAVQHNGWIYVIGGTEDGTSPVAICPVERAKILTSDTAPRIKAITSHRGDGTLGAGTWYYRVSAVMKETSAENPGGESLPSDEWSIRVEEGSSVTLQWDPPARYPDEVSFYRVYRTDTPNGISGTEHLIADNIAETNFKDTGLPAGRTSYLPPGSTGKWMCDNSTNFTSVYGNAVVKGRYPSGNTYFVYSIGGYNKSATGVVQYAEITAGGLGPWSQSTNTITSRYYLTAVFVNKDNAPVVGDNAYIYALGGTNDGSTYLNDSQIAPLLSNGDAGTWSDLLKKIPSSMGLMSVAIDNFIFDMCGTNAGGNKVVSGEITNSPKPGDVANWNAAGNGATTIWSRFLGGSVLETAYIYLIGGYGKCATNLCTEPSTDQALNTVEQVIW